MSSTIQPHSYLFREEEEKGRESRAKGDALSGNGDEIRGRLPRDLGLGDPKASWTCSVLSRSHGH